jgi:peptidoglycan/xylan/chitin deacetylase (PgdA/CDA1 family)
MDGRYLDLRSVPDWRDGLLALMYHLVEAPPLRYPLRGLYVEPELLDAQLAELKREADFVTLSAWAGGRREGRKVAVTFDDAYLDVLENALPVLRKHGVCSVTYVVTDEIGGTNRWDAGHAQPRPLMDRAALLDWQQGGQEIGSHGVSHCRLAEVSIARARAEIFDSRKMLEDLGGRPVRHFCYPYGNWNPAVRDLVAEAGYETATITEPGINDATTDLFALLRYGAQHRKPYQAAIKNRLLHPFGSHRPPVQKAR